MMPRTTKSPDSMGYSRITINGKHIREHRYVWEKFNGPIPKGWVIHHKNHNRLDNRIENLEAVPRATHQRIHAKEISEGLNKKGIAELSRLRRIEGKRTSRKRVRFTSQYKGVCFEKHASKWRARITISPGRSVSLGMFHSEEDAAKAYDDAAIQFFGKDARLNFDERKTG